LPPSNFSWKVSKLGSVMGLDHLSRQNARGYETAEVALIY
jgi:hypothetical protein